MMRLSEGGYLFPCSSEINWFVPQKSKICFLMFPVLQFCLCIPVLLKEYWPVFPFFLEINAPFLHVPQNPWEGFIYNKRKLVDRLVSK